MSALKVEQVHGSDLALKHALLNAGLPTDDIEDEGRTFS